MKRHVLLLAATGVMVAVAMLGAQKKKPDKLLILDWASRAALDTPPEAVLIEMGVKDDKPRDWSGQATVKGAKVVKREGYRFRTGDALAEPAGWKASSHRGLRVPPRNPAISRLEPIATVGVVLHLADVTPEATLTLDMKDGSNPKETVQLKDVLAGRSKALWKGGAVVRRISTSSPLTTGKTEDDFPAAAYGPDGTLWVAYISYTVKDESRRIEQEPLKEQPANFKALYTPEFGDQLFVKYLRKGKWSEPLAITGPREDLVRCAVGVEGNGDAWVVYSANRKGKYDLYARPISKKFNPAAVANPDPRPGPEQKVTSSPGPSLTPALCTDQDGALRLACQAWDRHDKGSNAQVHWFTLKDGKVTKGGALSGRPDVAENHWHPALSAGPGGSFALAFDAYREGDYDIQLKLSDNPVTHNIATSARFEARPSVAYDAKGRLWVAYEEGPENWGKDYGALSSDEGNPLYNARSVRVVCLQDGKLLTPAARLPTSSYDPPRIPFDPVKTQAFEKGTRYAYPKVGIDGKGRVWLTYRQKFGSRYTSHPGSYWLTFARLLNGDRWSEPIEVHHSDGLLDDRPVLLPHGSGGLLIIHNTDGRYTTPETINNKVYASVVDLPGEPVEPRLVAHEPGKKDGRKAKEERAAVKRMRDYRVEAGGKTYQLLRGEFHRHTEISWDGGADGSLEDMFRYAIDAAGMDWIGNADHDNGAGREYSWWLIQKFSDAYHVNRAFTPMFSYERSVPYPHGHRNCVFARRGVRTLPRLAQPDPEKRVAGIHADDTKMLYRYLKELDGICAAHTSATSMGTDWRDNDPQVEPVVEIYQGDRMSYEHEDAPRAGYDPKGDRKPANVAGWYPAGYVNNALGKKGYRLGFESSSDHWSTHISYCVVLAEKPDRAGILEAMKRRRTYGATDDIVVEMRSGDHLMGEEFRTSKAPTLEMRVVGTKPLERIDVLRDSEVVQTIKVGKAEYRGSWTDPKPQKGTHYYYIRVVQSDGELAWASPMWIEYSP